VAPAVPALVALAAAAGPARAAVRAKVNTVMVSREAASFKVIADGIWGQAGAQQQEAAESEQAPKPAATTPGDAAAGGKTGGKAGGEAGGEAAGGGAAAAAAGVAGTARVTAPPDDVLCALTRGVMAHAVRSPHGHVFDRAAIEASLDENGPVCPLTGLPLAPDDLEPDMEIQDRIVNYNIRVSLELNRDNTDIYDF
jgi:hypothetical protein